MKRQRFAGVPLFRSNCMTSPHLSLRMLAWPALFFASSIVAFSQSNPAPAPPSDPPSAQNQPQPAPVAQPGQTEQTPPPPDKRIFGVLPNYRTANATAVYTPITAKQK